MTAPALEQSPVGQQGGSLPPRGAAGGDGGSGGGGILSDPPRLGLWLFLGTITMMFVGFTSAYIARRASAGWGGDLDPPLLLWVNTLVLLASSVTVEGARRRLRRWEPGVVAWLGISGALGALFVAGQVAVWRSLAARGVLLAASAYNSFFYLLTGLHAVHLLGALAWFLVVLARARRLAYTPGHDGLGLFATFWHFLGALWLYLFLLLFVF